MFFLFIAIVFSAAGFFAWRASAEGRLDFRGVMRRASTILGLLTVFQGGAIVAFSQAPPAWQSQLPDWLPGYALIGMMLCGGFTALATSIQQKWLSPEAKK